jgi:predicted PurR-regulated permease PerM
MRPARFPIAWTWAAMTVALWGLSAAKSFFIPLCLSVILAFVMAPLLNLLRRFKVPEAVAIALCGLAVLLPVAFGASTLLREIEKLIHDFPELSRKINALVAPYLGKLHVSPFPLHLSSAETEFRVALASLKAVFEVGVEFLLVWFFSIVMLASRELIRSAAQALLVVHFGEQRAEVVVDSSVNLIERFLATRLLIMAAVVILDFGLPFAFLMACALGAMTWVPAVGFVIGVIPPLVVSLAEGGSLWKTAALYLCLGVIALINDHWVTPRFLGKSLNLNFFITCLGIFAGDKLWGLWGMFLSVPILGVLRVIFDSIEEYRPYSQVFIQAESKKNAA